MTHQRVHQGEPQRLCTGPAHDEPVWLPETAKYFYQHKRGKREGNFMSRCHLCNNWNRLKSPGLSGTVPADTVRSYYLEGIRRVGMVEFSRRTGINDQTVRNILSRKVKRVQKRVVRTVMLEVISMRRKGEARHRHSIRHGAKERGRVEKTPTKRQDFYHPNGDNDSEARRNVRKRVAEPT